MLLKFIRITIIIILASLISGCGYKAANVEKNFFIKEIKINDNKRYFNKLEKDLKKYNNVNSKNVLSISINNEINKYSKNKLKTGKITSYEIVVLTTLDIEIVNTPKKISKSFRRASDFYVGTYHSETINNEKRVLIQLIDSIASQINQYLRLQFQ